MWKSVFLRVYYINLNNIALFPLRVDNEIIFENKKLRGLGYSILRKQNTGRFIAFYLLSPW